MQEYSHYSVLLEESLAMLNIKEDGIYVDATTGGGGHSEEILKRIPKGHLYCFDQDEYALKRSEERLKKVGDNFTLIKANFADIVVKLAEIGVTKIDGVVYDLGVSSFQLDIPERGFSYRYDAILDMRMDQSKSLTAKTIVNTYTHQELSSIIFRYGDFAYAKNIASKICEYRSKKEIETTFELVDIIKSALPQKVLKQKGHPAKLVFQALRIAVNDELQVLEQSLRSVLKILNHDGYCSVITFQPTEDKIVKHIFKEFSTIDIPKGLPLANVPQADYEMVTKKPILPASSELDENNRSHSAKLRVIRRR